MRNKQNKLEYYHAYMKMKMGKENDKLYQP